MSKVLIVGDIHFNYLAPSSRIDDYGQTIINKMYWVMNYCVSKKIEHVLLLGDVFHQNQQPLWYLNKVIDLFSSFRDNNIDVFTIIGNHDVSYGRLDTISRTPLATLTNSGLIRYLDRTYIGNTEFVGVNYSDEVPKAETEQSVLLAHMFYEQPFDKDVLYKEDVSTLGYKAIVLGHDHNQYETVKIDGIPVYRFGSLSRGTSHRHHLIRDVKVMTMDTETLRTKLVIVPTEPSENIFTHDAMNKYHKESKDAINDFRESLEEFVENMAQVDESSDLWEIINSMELEPEVRDVVEHYLTAFGVV